MEDPKNHFKNFKDKPYRLGQEEAITRILEGGKKVVVICAPTGSGKSLAGMAAGASHDQRVISAAASNSNGIWCMTSLRPWP